jgi:hypothetical protein
MADGIYTNMELIDTVIVDLNDMIKEAANGRYLNACSIVRQMTVKLVNLRNTIDNDLKNRDKTIEILKEELRSAGVDIVDIPARELISETKKDGAE